MCVRLRQTAVSIDLISISDCDRIYSPHEFDSSSGAIATSVLVSMSTSKMNIFECTNVHIAASIFCQLLCQMHALAMEGHNTSAHR